MLRVRCSRLAVWGMLAWAGLGPLGGARADTDAAPVPVPAPTPVSAPAPTPAAAATEADKYTTRVLADRPGAATVERFALQGESLRTVPGSLGDPFRVLASLPGVASPIPGLPLFAVRGASPGTSGFFLDGMRLPQLFHLLVGGGVVHAGLVDRLDFFPSGYDVTFGRFAGGIVAASTRPAREGGQHFEGALRVYDASALVELALPRGVRISVSGHYGYPGPILRAIDDRIRLSYWDYQLRLDWKGLTVQALGGYDSLELKTESEDATDWVAPQNTRMQFHRLQIRERLSLGPAAIEAALVGGLDEAGDVQGRGVRKLFVSARSNATLRWTRLKIYAGLDAEVARFEADRFDLGVRNLAFVRDAEGPARTSARDPDKTPDELGEIGDDRVGVTAGAQLQATIDIVPQKVLLTAGARLDVYHAGTATLIGLDPRAQLSIKPQPWLELRVAGGVYQQPPTFPILLPGIDTFALKLGLQRSIGGTVSQEVKLPASFTLSATGFYQQFKNLSDLPPLGARVCAPPALAELTGTTATLMRTTDGAAYGMELLLRRTSGRVSGWIAYTLSRSDRQYPCGLRPADYDQTHLLNVVVQARLGRGVTAGARLYLATGRPETQVDPQLSTEAPHSDVLVLRNNVRLPTFVQLDLRVDKEWHFKRWSLGLFAEIVNATFSRTVLYLAYPDTNQEFNAPSKYGKPSEVGFHWILPSIGLKGGF